MIGAAESRYKCLGWSVMKIFRLLADPVMAVILKTSLDASQTRPLVACSVLSVIAL